MAPVEPPSSEGGASLLVSVVFSFFNEEEVIPELLARVGAALDPGACRYVRDYELIFVNDRSTDSSLEILTERARQDPRIKIVNMSRNFGVSPCVMAGFSYASGDVVVYLDADLQDPPELIPEMLEAMVEQGAHVVHAKRLRRDGETWLKLQITRLGYFILNRLSDVPIEPNVGDFKVLSRRVVDELLQLEEYRPFMRGLVRWVGFHQVQVTYDREPRQAGETKFPVLSHAVIGNFLDSALISFSGAPLRAALILGFLVSAGAFLYLVAIFVMFFLGWNIPGWSAIMATMLVLGGVQLLGTGILGLYIHTIYNEAKPRPLYIVEGTVGFDGGAEAGDD